MRVRHLQSHLQDQGLINEGKLKTLRGLRIGIDAVYWLRSIQALKDPFADALGGVPPGIFGFVDRELELFRKHDITPFFIFQGIAPGPQHSMFINRMDQQMEAAWTYLVRGQKSEAQKCFAVSTSRINGDFVYFIFHHLRQRGCEVLMAPYFAGAQLAHFAEQKVVHSVFGPPGLLLYNVQRVIIAIDFGHNNGSHGPHPHGGFEWVDLKSVLAKWSIDQEQFVDACMMAGTEYCLTYPYLSAFTPQPPPQPAQGQSSTRFNFEAAVNIIKQAPLINWMQSFESDAMKSDHVEGYCICKVFVHSSPVLHTQSCEVRPLGGTGAPGRDSRSPSVPQVPNDLKEIMGEKLPSSLYYLMVQGIIGQKLPQAFARGEWVDKSQPLVDTAEFRSLLLELNDYREKAINLVVRHLNKSFQKKTIVCKAFWDQPSSRQPHYQQAAGPNKPHEIHPDPTGGKRLRWRITQEALDAEMTRQGTDRVDLKFCLNWHAEAFNNEWELFKDLSKYGESSFTKDQNSLSCLVHFMLLEHLELIADDGGMTVIGNALKDSPRHLMEPCLIALELMKFGLLTGEPFEPGQEDRPFPPQMEYPKQPVDPKQKSILLLTRVMSLVPMRLRIDMWNADVNFDLAAFHAMVRILKRALRQLTEASLTSILMKDLQQVKLLPAGFLCASPTSKDHLQPHALLPTFMLPRACMGIVVHFVLTYTGDPAQFQKELAIKFPCCVQPRQDLMQGIIFWEDVSRVVGQLCDAGLELETFAEDMKNATKLLREKQNQLGLHVGPSALRGDEHEKVKAIVVPTAE